MTIVALAILIFCFWAVFSPRVNDGIVAKHFFSVSAITAVLYVRDTQNKAAMFTASVLILCGLVAWYLRTQKAMRSGQSLNPKRRCTDA